MSEPTVMPLAAGRFAFDGVLAAAGARRGPVDPTTTRVVVGVDDSPASTRALQWAGRLAGTLGDAVEIEVVIVVGFPEWVYEPGGHHPERDAAEVARDVVRAVFGAMPPATVHVAVDDGDPVTRLLAQGEGAVLLVVGSRVRRAGAEPPDSVGLRVAALAAGPVLVVH